MARKRKLLAISSKRSRMMPRGSCAAFRRTCREGVWAMLMPLPWLRAIVRAFWQTTRTGVNLTWTLPLPPWLLLKSRNLSVM